MATAPSAVNNFPERALALYPAITTNNALTASTNRIAIVASPPDWLVL
jgi:hypothetical protein